LVVISVDDSMHSVGCVVVLRCVTVYVIYMYDYVVAVCCGAVVVVIVVEYCVVFVDTVVDALLFGGFGVLSCTCVVGVYTVVDSIAVVSVAVVVAGVVAVFVVGIVTVVWLTLCV